MLMVHNLFRWIVILALLWGLIRAYRGWLGKKAWMKADRRTGMLLTFGYDIQFLLGLILTFLSPIVATAFSNLVAAMQVAELRFFAVEHIPMMFLALVVGHITSVFSRKAQDDSVKHRRAALGFTVVAVITLLAIPWSRPLLRF
jgi:hypothetical protein